MLCYNCFQEKNTEEKCPHCGYDPQKQGGVYPLALTPGTILNGRYILGRVLGQGGFGITYLAQNYASGERLAIKEYLPGEFATRPTGEHSVMPYSGEYQESYEYGKEQFLQEAETLANFIGVENIVRVYSFFEENNTAYLAMEYVNGIGLDSFMKQHGGSISVEEANRLLLPLCDALGAVHAKGIVHRDIAPDNILVSNGGSIAKLIDFGAARYSIGEKSKSLDVILKHGFAPIEQYSRHGKQGPFTDVYALSATYYYAISGKIPQEAIDRITEDEILPPSALNPEISPELEAALMKGLAVQARDRYSSMAEMRSGFDAALLAGSGNKAAPAAEADAPAEPLQQTGKLPDADEPPAAEEAEQKTADTETQSAEDAAVESNPVETAEPKAAPKKARRKRRKKRIHPLVLLTVFLAAACLFAVLLLKSIAPEVESGRYNAALSYLYNGNLPGAYAAFYELGDYKDSREQAEAVKTALLSSTITFGSYEQDNDDSNGTEPIEWQVLAIDGEKALLVSRYALDSQPYNSSDAYVTWENCSLRSWLNGSFLGTAFTEEEQKAISTTTVPADPNPQYGSSAGNDTKDAIFLLSIAEAQNYFASDPERKCEPTAYAKAQCAAYSTMDYWWWLRSPGNDNRNAAYVNYAGFPYLGGNYVYVVTGGVRPALWLALSASQ